MKLLKSRSRIKNLKEVNTCEFLCLHSIRSMELIEKTELLRILSAYALPKIHLDRYGSFRKILLILSWDIHLNSEPVHGIQIEHLLHVLLFHDCIFFGDNFFYNLNSLSENVSKNEWNVFKKRGMLFICIDINSLLPKTDEVHYIANMCLSLRLLLE